MIAVEVNLLAILLLPGQLTLFLLDRFQFFFNHIGGILKFKIFV